jgi:thymidylate synthase (FAD)
MKVELIAKTQGVGQHANLTDEQLVVYIARHLRVKPGEEKLINHFMQEKHWSPLDMINYVFGIHTSLPIATQILRHKSMNCQQLSQRYESPTEFEPIELRMQHEKNRQSSTEVFDPMIGDIKASEKIDLGLRYTKEMYDQLIDAGVAKECARMVLPQCTSTVITVNGTLRSWLSFLNIRMDYHAQKEIRLVAQKIGEELEKHMPTVFSKIDWRNGLFM